MDIQLLKSKFSNEALSVIEAEVRDSIESSFSAMDLSENTHVIEPFYVQPMFYATLLNYYTMHQQHSTVSLLEMASDDNASEADKDAIAQSFASELNIDLTGQTVENKLMIINSAISTSDSRIKKLQASISSGYNNAVFVVSGASKEMFRNSPEHKMFANSRFAIPFLYEGMSTRVASPSILNQAISISDANRYTNMTHSGRSGNSADVFLAPIITKTQHTISANDGGTDQVILPVKKYAHINFIENYGLENVNFEFSTIVNIGFEERSIIINATDRCSVTIEAYHYEDDTTIETNLKSQFPSLDVMFSGMVPIYVDLIIQNTSGLQTFIDAIKETEITKKWMATFKSESSRLSQFGNRSLDMSGEMMVNPIVSRPIAFFNGNIAISGNSIMSWVTESNSCIIPRQVTVLETGDVTLF